MHYYCFMVAILVKNIFDVNIKYIYATATLSNTHRCKLTCNVVALIFYFSNKLGNKNTFNFCFSHFKISFCKIIFFDEKNPLKSNKVFTKSCGSQIFTRMLSELFLGLGLCTVL